MKFQYFIEMAIDGEIGNFVGFTLFENMFAHPDALSCNIQLFGTLKDGLSIKAAHSLGSMSCIMVSHISMPSLLLENFGSSQALRRESLRKKFGDSVKGVILKLGNMEVGLLRLRT
jgi:hypothetical protein